MSIRFLYKLMICLFIVACNQQENGWPDSMPAQTDTPETSGQAIPAPQGQSVGNGGNPLHSLFEEGRNHAVHILERIIREEHLALLGTNLKEKELSWLFTNKTKLITKIEAANHVWDAHLPKACPKSVCACTLPKDMENVYLSYQNCDADAKTDTVAELLVHEHLHQFPFVGKNEDRADRIAHSPFEAWLKSGHPKKPHWLQIPKELGFTDDLAIAEAFWTGNELLVLSRSVNDEPESIAMGLYDPSTRSWTKKKPSNLWSDFSKKKKQSYIYSSVPKVIPSFPNSRWAGEKLVIHSDCHRDAVVNG